MHFGSDEYGFVGVAPRRVVVDLCGRFVSPWIDRAVHPRIAEKRNPQRSSEGERWREREAGGDGRRRSKRAMLDAKNSTNFSASRFSRERSEGRKG